LRIVKTVERPKPTTSVGDFTFEVSCTLAGDAISLPTGSSPFTLVFADEVEYMEKVISGLPIGASCTVTEVETGSADVVAQDRTVTIPAGTTAVVADMTNIFDPAELDLTVDVEGSAVDAGTPWIPTSWDSYVDCTRQLMINGVPTEVTDFSGYQTVELGVTTVIGDLPAGSHCTVTEPNSKGANHVTISVVTTGVANESTADEIAIFSLRGVDMLRAIQSTDANILNRYDLVTVTVVQECQYPPIGVALPYDISATYIDEFGTQQDVPLGIDHFTLKCNQVKKVGVPSGAEVTITQTDLMGSTLVSVMIGEVDPVDPTVTVLADEDLSVTYLNAWVKPATGGAVADGADLGGILTSLVFISAGAVIIRRRRSDN